MRFCATILLNGKTATGIQVPDEVMTALGLPDDLASALDAGLGAQALL